MCVSLTSDNLEHLFTCVWVICVLFPSATWWHVICAILCVCVCFLIDSYVCVPSCLSRVQLFATLWTVACQAPLSMGFSRQEYWSGLALPYPGDLPDPRIKPGSFRSSPLAVGIFTLASSQFFLISCAQIFVTYVANIFSWLYDVFFLYMVILVNKRLLF